MNLQLMYIQLLNTLESAQQADFVLKWLHIVVETKNKTRNQYNIIKITIISDKNN